MTYREEIAAVAHRLGCRINEVRCEDIDGETSRSKAQHIDELLKATRRRLAAAAFFVKNGPLAAAERMSADAHTFMDEAAELLR